ncbi:MAG: M50 family metallopeptidase [Eubacteriales bacterium]|nr:M50 family metallopeptidase [Eubacteriales bacterium]
MKGLRIFGKKLKVNLLLIPAVIILFVFGMGEAVLYFIPVLIIHEWAHILAAAALGMTITEMELWPFGCAAKMQCFAMSRAREIIVAAAGPAVNMVFACLVFIIDKSIHTIAIADRLITANITIAAINMLPALPLDGGRIARAAFSSFMGNRRATKVTAISGVFFSAVLLGFGVYAAIGYAFNPSFFIMGFFLCLSAVKEFKNAPYTLIRDFSGKRDTIEKRRTLSINRFAAMQSEKLCDIMREFEAGKYNIVTVLDNNMGVVGELDERRILDGMMQKGTHATLRSIYMQR